MYLFILGVIAQYYHSPLEEAPVAQMLKNPSACAEDLNSGLGRSPGRAWQPTPVFLLGESPWTEEPGGL